MPKKINVIRLSSVHYQVPDLSRERDFLKDFGLTEVARDNSRSFFTGFGVEPYVFFAEQSPDSKRHFLGGSWAAATEEDLRLAASHPKASQIHDRQGPGGGKIVTITDPNGFPVSFIFGQQLKPRGEPTMISRSSRDDSELIQNKAYDKPRKGKFRRFNPGPSPVHKPGHYGYGVPASKYKETFEWYTSLMNLSPTDAVFDPQTGEDKTCFMHIDLGMEYSDHHSFFLGALPEHLPAFVHHSSFEVNDMDTQSLGHDWLVAKGWTNCWGIGRHVLGSQIFDYWFDGAGNILEHYSDGDEVNQETPFSREPEAPDSLYIWGPNIPLGFVTGRIEDAGKYPPTPAPTPSSAAANA
ncbi:oxidoreductase [Zopfia rhizophila CBS 207.26]|uniref:Oxidoreductase n=1 Tax=Zopfia rhizophila CBS 207.26 TaxID=1314779 RepID=A0A6A6E6M4_9PEZI|nr:oxidoreductase [Zopfia rhizophila CBS 207.26]